MKTKNKRNRIRAHFRFHPITLSALRSASRRNGQTVTWIVEHAIAERLGIAELLSPTGIPAPTARGSRSATGSSTAS